jgi:hypothetical protein
MVLVLRIFEMWRLDLNLGKKYLAFMTTTLYECDNNMTVNEVCLVNINVESKCGVQRE